MLLIVDSGSHKTDWTFRSEGFYYTTRTSGINPMYNNNQELTQKIALELTDCLDFVLDEIVFYGAGCGQAHIQERMKNILLNLFRVQKVEVHSDLVGAARATCKSNQAFVGILGTGSNSGFYNGQTITNQIVPLGFLLGDEGSGARIGQQLLRSVMRNELPKQLTESFWQTMQLSPEQIMSELYQSDYPNAYLAEFVPFVKKNLNLDCMQDLINTNLSNFIQNILLKYPDIRNFQVHFVGGIAHNFSDQLRALLHQNSIEIGIILNKPTKELINYHS